MVIDEGGPLSCRGNSGASGNGKTDTLRFAGPTISVIPEALDRIALDGGGVFAGMSCSTAGGDCATMVVLRDRVDATETDARREREGVFGMGSSPGAGSPPVLADPLPGIWVNASVESKLPVLLECLDGSRSSRGLMRRVPWEAEEEVYRVASESSRGGSCSSLKSLITRLASRPG